MEAAGFTRRQITAAIEAGAAATDDDHLHRVVSVRLADGRPSTIGGLPPEDTRRAPALVCRRCLGRHQDRNQPEGCSAVGWRFRADDESPAGRLNRLRDHIRVCRPCRDSSREHGCHHPQGRTT